MIMSVPTRAVTRVGITRVQLELDFSQLGRVGFVSTRVFELYFYVLQNCALAAEHFGSTTKAHMKINH